MTDRIDIRISDRALDQEACMEFVRDDSCGGICVFVGTVRNSTQGKQVTRLDFSAYRPMALKEMKKIGDECLRDFGVFRISIHQYAIDRLKETVPIWKKEYFHDGEVWVNAHP